MHLTVVDDQRSSLMIRLDVNELEFANSLAGVSYEAAHFRESHERWNILQLAEHVVDSEWRMSHFMNSAFELDAPRVRVDFEDILQDVSRYRNRRLFSPKSRPGGRFLYAGEALERFYEARSANRRYATPLTEEQLRSRGGYDLMVGDLSCYECLLALMADATLCAAQILDLRRAHARAQFAEADAAR